MAAIPTIEQEDAKRPHREREALLNERTSIVNRMKALLIQFGVRNFNPKLRYAANKLDSVRTPEGTPLPIHTAAMLRRLMERKQMINVQIKAIEQTREQRLKEDPSEKRNTMVLMLTRIVGLGVETGELLVHELLSRNLRDRKAVARYAGLTGSPDESGTKRREKGLARAGNGRVRKTMIQLSWRMLQFQPGCDLVRWYQQRTEGTKGLRNKLIVALARKLILALWRYVETGLVPDGMKLRPSVEVAAA